MAKVNVIIANGGGGLKIADAFVQQCLASSKNAGETHIFVHETDRNCSDLNALRFSCANYNVIRKYSNNKYACTDIVLEEQNLSDIQSSDEEKDSRRNIGQLINRNDPRKIGLDGCYSREEEEMDLDLGLYGKGHVGAAKNMDYRSRFKSKNNNSFYGLVEDHLSRGNSVYVASIGSTDGGTGRSFAFENLNQIWQSTQREYKERLRLSLVLLGPCMSHGAPDEEEEKLYPNLKSGTSYLRTYEVLQEILREKENVNRVIDRLYICGIPSQDDGKQGFCSNNQERHMTHLLHYSAAQFIRDFFDLNSVVWEDKESTDINWTSCLNVENGDAPDMTWTNVFSDSSEVESNISFMRFSDVLCYLVAPFFNRQLDEINTSLLFVNAKKRFLGSSPKITQTALAEINSSLEGILKATSYFAFTYQDLQDCSTLGSGRTDYLKLFDEDELKGISSFYRNPELEDYKMVIAGHKGEPEKLTENIFNTGNAFEGHVLFDQLSENKTVKAAIRAYSDSNNENDMRAVTTFLKTLLDEVYKQVEVQKKGE